MNRDKALSIADRIMTRIETDKAIHKDAIADEIQAGDALDEIVDVINHDGEKWVHRDGTPFDTDADVKQEGIDGANPKWTDEEVARIMARSRVEPLRPNRISDREAIQKAWREVMAHCKAWPPADVIKARLDKVLSDKDADKTKPNRLTVDGPEVMRTTTVGRDIVSGAASTVIDLDDKDTA